MRKEYRNAIIGGIGGGIVGTVLLYIILGKVAWAYLFMYPIFTAIAHLIGVSLRRWRKRKRGE